VEFVLLLAIFLTSSGFLIAAPRTPEPPAAVAAVTPSAVGSIAGSEVALPPPSESAATVTVSSAHALEPARQQ